MSADTVGAKLQEVWREIIAAETARGSTAAEVAAETAAAYEDALRRFRHIQIEAFTVSLGELVLIREVLDELEARVRALEAGKTKTDAREIR